MSQNPVESVCLMSKTPHKPLSNLVHVKGA